MSSIHQRLRQKVGNLCWLSCLNEARSFLDEFEVKSGESVNEKIIS